MALPTHSRRIADLEIRHLVFERHLQRAVHVGAGMGRDLAGLVAA